MEWFNIINNWLEVWALFIPLFFIFKIKQTATLLPICYYVVAAIFINLLSIFSWKFKHQLNFPVYFQVNTYFYSIHSICRYFLFWWFFKTIHLPYPLLFKTIIPLLFVLFLGINFSYEPFVNYWFDKGVLQSTISYRLLSLEACLMLFYSLAYYISKLKEDKAEYKTTPGFWIVSGLCIFSMVSFPIYLFYPVILDQSRDFTIRIWNIQKLAFLVFCICLAKGLSFKPHDRVIV